MYHICSKVVTYNAKQLIFCVFTQRGILIRNGNGPPSSLFGEVRATFPKLYLCLVFLSICTLQVLQCDLHKKHEYEFLDQVQGNFCILRKRSFCFLQDLVGIRLVCWYYIRMNTWAPCVSLKGQLVLIHLYYKLYSYCFTVNPFKVKYLFTNDYFVF